MKRHIEWFTGPDQTLKDRSRFWTWNMRGLHGDMDTRYEGDRRSSTTSGPQGRHLYTSSEPSGFNFRPLASNTYGYHPKGVSLHRRPDAGLAAQHALAHETAPVLDSKRPNWSTSLKPLDDVMLMREPRSASVPPRRSMLPPSSSLRGMPIDPALDDLLKPRVILPRRGLANRIWRPSLFLDDDALLKPSSWINDPWWHKYPELRPLDLATVPWTRPPSNFRSSYLSPIKRTYVWGYRHPLRPFGYNSWEYRY
ncbi:uncharacterized protein LOC116920798 isoform X1 [Daphnia magna]|uniref:Uncharacterized protein n=2 Tax=Daphnia magna TaxID=35525 RepID=A0A0P5MZ69_9CRUS|nr:uncharacterized protein LOC116920798 isoform X1 [Daphnia magna]KAK4003498.1 hypothetical protein OUZ56_005258 [Daphnia magna]KZS11585.1 Uncharacterized protein APZ42_023701 [Daphnia magna]